MAAKKKDASKAGEPVIKNRKARHDYVISETLECGVRLLGTEVKAIRMGRCSLQEGYVRASENPLELHLHSVHIGEYPPAGPEQHEPVRVRRLLAHKREIAKLAQETRQKGVTIVPLKMYFKDGKIKLEIGIARGKRKADKRRAMDEKQARKEIDRALSKRR